MNPSPTPHPSATAAALQQEGIDRAHAAARAGAPGEATGSAEQVKRDTIIHRTTTHLDFRDRIRALIGSSIEVRSELDCAVREDGSIRVEGARATPHVARLFTWPWDRAVMAEECFGSPGSFAWRAQKSSRFWKAVEWLLIRLHVFPMWRLRTKLTWVKRPEPGYLGWVRDFAGRHEVNDAPETCPKCGGPTMVRWPLWYRAWNCVDTKGCNWPWSPRKAAR